MRGRMMAISTFSSGGFTLWELLCTLAVAAVVLALGLPSMRAILLDAQRTATVEAFVSAVQLARSEAAKIGRDVVLCPSTDANACGNTTNFGGGWIVFVNEDGARPAQRGPHEPLLRAYRPAMSGSILANRSAFEFRPFLKRSTNGTVTFCDQRKSAHARAVIMSYTGRPRVSTFASGRRPLDCPP